MAAGPGAIGRHILSARRHQPHLKIADRFTRLPGLAQYGDLSPNGEGKAIFLFPYLWHRRAPERCQCTIRLSSDCLSSAKRLK